MVSPMGSLTVFFENRHGQGKLYERYYDHRKDKLPADRFGTFPALRS